MVVFPSAKINLGLNVVKRRKDGFHDIETLFYPIELKDILEIIPNGKKEATFQSSGIAIPGTNEGNLVMQAYQLLAEDYAVAGVDFHLHKIIPIGAGLGGGSADASFALKALNDFFDLGLSFDVLENYARKLGSDCAFFIKNTPVFAQGKGDEFAPITLSLKGKYLVLVNPGIHVSTALAYQGLKPQNYQRDIIQAIKEPVANWKNLLINDFETTVFAAHPEIKSIKELLYANGAEYAAMSGSGSSVFGIFAHSPEKLSFSTGQHWILPLM